jgi:hypothetical protein
MSLHELLAAASRARSLANDLSRSDRDVDRHQVASGVRHELDTVLRLARGELERLAEAAEGDRVGKVRTDAPGTSQAAARSITLKTGTTRWAILERLWLAGDASPGGLAYRWEGGMTDWELQKTLQLNPSTERPRRGELVDAGLVTDAGRTRIHDGREWTVWALTQAGADAYRERVPGPPRTITRAGEPTLF